MKTDKVSVLMTVYNTAKYLDRSINSIIKQTYKNFELIIVDDGSEDNSKKIISSYKNKKIKKFFLKKMLEGLTLLNMHLKKALENILQF